MAFCIALVPVVLAWIHFRQEAWKRDQQLFEATAKVAGEQLQLVLVRHQNVFHILRNQLRSLPVPARDALRIPTNFRETFPHVRAFGYAAARGGGAVLEWVGSDQAAPCAVGENVANGKARAAVLERAARVPSPVMVLDGQDGSSAFVACAVGDGPAPRGFVVGWLDIVSLCQHQGSPLIASGVLSVVPLPDGVVPPVGSYGFVIREGETQVHVAIARGAAYRATYPLVSPVVVLWAGSMCACLLALVVFQRMRTVQIQAALHTERLRARLVQNFSHEFRTPLSVILSSTDLLDGHLERLEQGRRQEVILQIRESAERMSEMLSEILLLNRLENNPQPVRKEVCEISVLCNAAARDVGLALKMRCRIEVEASGTMRTDPWLLRGILTNVLSNAVKYSAQGARVRLQTRFEHGMVVLTVSDTGIGIPSVELHRMGEVFCRASNVGEVPGTGLGLAIVRRSVKLLGGFFEIHSEEGKGTRSIIRLPEI